jgi:NADH:ubiquinone oxidoreductase subunit C
VNVPQILSALREAYPKGEISARQVPVKETFVYLPAERVRTAVGLLVEAFGVSHLSTLTGVDTGERLELLYHFWEGEGLTLCTSLPRYEASIPTVTDLIPGAAFYEREVGEMLHVTFQGIPDPSPLLLPDDWSGEAPLRTEFTLEPSEEQGEDQ